MIRINRADPTARRARTGKFYGQFGTDHVIRSYFPDQDTGNCIEVGAVDGVFISNTLHFEENGWNVLCIEPIPHYFEKLKRNRKNALNYAVSNVNADNVKFTVVEMANKNLSSVSGLKLDEKLFEDHVNLNLRPVRKVISVAARRLDWCIDHHFKHNTIDFISIDTEGNELDVLKSFDVNGYNSRLMVIENNYDEPTIERYLAPLGWRKDQRVEVNDFYVKVL